MTQLYSSFRSLMVFLIVFTSLCLVPKNTLAQGPVNVYVDVIELNHGYDCGSDAGIGTPDPRWKFWGGHSGGNWVYYGCYNGGERNCGVWNIGDFDLINVTNTTATQVNVDMESWEEDGCGGDCDANTCTFNDDDCRSGRARIFDINFRRDAPNVYNQSGWGYRGCSYGARVDVYYECLDWGDQTTYGNGSWRGYVYDGTGFNTYMGYITQNETFDQTFGGDGDGDWYPTSCREFQKSTFSVRYKMTKNFPCGYYTFTAGSDDGVRLSIDGGNTWIINQWVDRGYVTNSSASVFLSGNANLVLEYYENTGGNRVSFNYSYTAYTPPGNPSTFGNGLWNVYAWNAGDATGGAGAWSTNYSGYYTINALNFDTRPGQTYSNNSWDTGLSPSSAPGWVGCSVNNDNHSYAFKRQNFPCGYYQINLPNHDDRVVLYVNGVNRYDQSACCQTRTNIWQGFLGPNSTVELRISEGGGGSHGSIELVKQFDLAITSSSAAMNCTDGARSLTANASGGVWSGPGVSGSSFNPSAAGSGTHTISYSLEGCTVTQTISVSAPGNPLGWGPNQWYVYAYNGNNFTTYYGYYVVNSLDIDTRDQWVAGGTPSSASGYQGCTVPVDQHSYKLRRQGFPCGFYNISVSNDDDWVLNVNGSQLNAGGCCSTTPVSAATNVWLDASSTVELTIREGGGDSYGEVNFSKTGDLSITSSNAGMTCSGASRSLTANVAGGTWSGPGVSGSSFNPTSAGLGTHTITYTLNGCTATQQIAVGAPGNPATFGNNVWNVYAYNAGDGQGTGGDWVNNYSGYYTISNLSFDTRTGQTYSTAQSWPDSPSQASGYQGCNVGIDNHSWTAKRTNFSCGLYKISIVGHDDIAQLWIDGVKVFDNFPWSGAASQTLTYPYTAWMGELSASSTVEFRVGEAGGGAFGAIEVVPVTASAMTATVTDTDVDCFGANNGSLNVNLSGGLSNARVIKITQKMNDFLNLAEVQAFDLNGNNVALSSGGATATASSSHASGSYPPTNLINGNTGDFAHSGNVTDSRGQWMQITLPASAQLDRIVVYNRTDCCQNRSANLLVEVFSDVAATNLIMGKTINASAPYPTPVTINVMDLNWSNGATTLNQSNLAPGRYNLTVTNAAFCGAGNATGGATITQPADLTVSASATNETCIGNNDGAVNITVGGGVTNYNFSWSNGATTEDISGLAAGTYTVTVTDANGCTETASANVSVTPAINNSISGGGPTAYCNFGDPTSMGGAVTGGTGAYSIQWEMSTNGSTYSPIGGATASSYDPGQITQSTWYRRVVNSGPCTEISNVIAFTVTYQTTYTWTGAVSSDWNVDGNWDCGHVPDNTKDVIIPSAPANQPVIFGSNTGECNSIDVQSGANVTIQPNATLNVNN